MTDSRFSNLRRVVATLALTLAVAVLAGVPGPASAQEGTPVATPAAVEGASYLYVQAGFTGGRFDATSEEGLFVLVLEGAPAQTVYFSDRPARDVGLIATEEFLETFDFTDDPPNAALVFATEDGGTDVIVVELTQPSYDAEAGTLTYMAQVLALEEEDAATFGLTEEPLTAEAIPLTFGSGTLFIDSSCSPWDPRC
jgi:hypothetical protein